MALKTDAEMIGSAQFTPEADVFAWSAAPELVPSASVSMNSGESTFGLVRCSEQPTLDRTKTTGEDATTRCLMVEPQGSGSSLVALVPAVSPPVVVRLFDARQSKRIRDLTFPSCVRGVRLNMKRMVVMLDDQVQIFDAETLRNLHRFDAPRQSSSDSCALSPNCVLALGAARTGSVLLFDALNLRVLQVIPAHQTSVTCLALSENGQLLATASETGTLVRLFSVVTGEKLCVFRRGSKSCRVRCLRFSSAAATPGGALFLAVGSDNGTVHVFQIPPQFAGSQPSANSVPGDPVTSATSQIASFLSNLLPGSVSDLVEPSRCFCLARTFGIPLVCCFAAPAASASDLPSKSVLLRIVTSNGVFREYFMDLANPTFELPLRRYIRLLGDSTVVDDLHGGDVGVEGERESEEEDGPSLIQDVTIEAQVTEETSGGRRNEVPIGERQQHEEDEISSDSQRLGGKFGTGANSSVSRKAKPKKKNNQRPKFDREGYYEESGDEY